MNRADRIYEAIESCRHCGSYEFPKRHDCDGCISFVDEEIAIETNEYMDYLHFL